MHRLGPWLLVMLALGALLATGCAAGGTASPTPAPRPTNAVGAAPAPTAAAAAARPTEPAAPPVAVRVGLQGSLSDAGVFVGVEQGYYRELGLDVEAVPVRAIADMLPMLLSGQLEGAGVGINAGTLNAVGRQAGVKLVAEKGSVTPGHGYLAWVVRKELVDSGRFQADDDVRGQRVGLNPPVNATQSAVAFRRLLTRLQLTPEDVDLRPLSFPDILAALGGGAIDSGILPEPLVSAGVQNGVLVRWRGLDELYPRLGLGAIAYATRFSDAEPTAARSFMVGYLRSVRRYLDAMDHHRGRDEVVAALVKHTDVKDPALYNQMVPAGLDPDGRLALEILADSIEAYRAAGVLTQPVDAATAVDQQYAEYARERLGPYHP